MDWSDEFDRHITTLNKDGAPMKEIDAAVMVYERLKTARTICNSLDTPDLLESVFTAIGQEANLVVYGTRYTSPLQPSVPHSQTNFEE